MRYSIIYLLFVILAVFTIFPEEDPDLFWHLKVGEWMCQYHKVLEENPFLSTHPTGGWERWVNYQWLSEVLFFKIYSRCGINGLILLKGIIWLSVFALLFGAAYGRGTYLINVFVGLITLFVAQARFSVRPEMFSYLFLAAYLFILQRYRLKYNRLIYLFPLLQIIWVNTHLYFFLGPLFIFVYLAADSHILRRGYSTEAPGEIRGKRLFYVGILSALCCLVNPSGLRGASIPLRIFASANTTTYFAEHISELQPLWHLLFTDRGHIVFYYKVLVVASLLSFILNRKNAHLPGFFLYAVFLAFSLKWIRFIALFGLLVMAQTITNLYDIFLDWKQKIKIEVSPLFKSIVQFLVFLCLGTIFLTSTNLFSAQKILNVPSNAREFGLGLSKIAYPQKAVEFIKGLDLRGNIFHNFEMGGYLDWHLYPRKKAFIDGTIGVYGKNLWEDYLKAFQLRVSPAELAEKYQISCFLLWYNNPVSHPLLGRLYKDKQWKLIYVDELVLIFVQDSPQNKGLVDKYQIDLMHSASLLANKMDKRNLSALGYLAEFLCALKEFPAAQNFYESALLIMPKDAGLYQCLGNVYYEQGLYDLAISVYKKSLVLHRGYFQTYYGLGMCYVKKGDYPQAVDSFLSCLQLNPRYSMGHYNLAVAYTQLAPAQIGLAARHLKQAVKLGFHPDPRFAKHLKKMVQRYE